MNKGHVEGTRYMRRGDSWWCRAGESVRRRVYINLYIFLLTFVLESTLRGELSTSTFVLGKTAYRHPWGAGRNRELG